MKDKSHIYVAPLAEIIELCPEGVSIMHSGGTESEKFVIGSKSYNDSDFE